MSSYAFTWLKGSAVGAWDVNVITGAMPQKVATAIGELSENLMGASYEPIAYLGKQVVNGVNHAVLALQTLVLAQPVKNIVILKFNEKDMDCNLIGIETLVQSGPACGGYNVDPKVGDEIGEDALKAFEKVTAGWVGSTVCPVALLATKVVKGIDMLFACTVTPVYPGAKASFKLVLVNGLTGTLDFEDVF